MICWKLFLWTWNELSDLVGREVVKKRMYNKLNTKVNNLENKIHDATNLIHINTT